MGRNTCASSSRRVLETFIIISIIITIIFYTTFTHTHKLGREKERAKWF